MMQNKLSLILTAAAIYFMIFTNHTNTVSYHSAPFAVLQKGFGMETIYQYIKLLSASSINILPAQKRQHCSNCFASVTKVKKSTRADVIIQFRDAQWFQSSHDANTQSINALINLRVTCSLKGVQHKECHHKTEKTHGFRQSKTKNGICEKLLFASGIPGVSNYQISEYCSDTST